MQDPSSTTLLAAAAGAVVGGVAVYLAVRRGRVPADAWAPYSQPDQIARFAAHNAGTAGFAYCDMERDYKQGELKVSSRRATKASVAVHRCDCNVACT